MRVALSFAATLTVITSFFNQLVVVHPVKVALFPVRVAVVRGRCVLLPVFTSPDVGGKLANVSFHKSIPTVQKHH